MTSARYDFVTTRRKPLFLGLAGLLAVLVLAACYLPNNFKSEIRLGRDGSFAFYFTGELVWAPLYSDIYNKKIPPDEIPGKVEEIARDLKRDSNFTLVEPVGNTGRFKVEYKRQGLLKADDLVTFVRRNAIILQIRATPDGLVTVNGASMKPGDAQLATTMGLDLTGEFRIITGGAVREQNANSVRMFNGFPVYLWNISSAFSPPPHFVMQREGAWSGKGKEGQ